MEGTAVSRHITITPEEAHAEREAIGAVRQLSQDYLPTKNDPETCKFCDFRNSGGCVNTVSQNAAA